MAVEVLISAISRISGLPIDKSTYVFFLFVSLCSAVLFGKILHPRRVGPTVRHLAACILGLYIGFHSYSWSMLHLLSQATVGYILMLVLNPKIVHKVVFIVAFLYLSVEHIRRLMRNHTSDFDHIGAMMILTARITSLAFGLHDGLDKDTKLSSSQKKLSVRRVPTVIEFYSYAFNFQCLTVGPFCFYSDYIHFIEGNNLKPLIVKTEEGKEKIIHQEPPVLAEVVQKCSLGVILGIIHLIVEPHFTGLGNIDPDVLNSGFIYRLWYLWISMVMVQSKYIMAWSFADAICNASGFGFSGYDSNGDPKWDLTTNIRFLGYVTCQNMRQMKDSWHMSINPYLRYGSFERVSNPGLKLSATLLLSCVWHGFYPGYFWTIANIMLLTQTSKQVRHRIRPYFLSSKEVKRFYDIFTWICHQFMHTYNFLPFVLLSNENIINFYSRWHFSGHISMVVVMLVALAVPPLKKHEVEESNSVTITSKTEINNSTEINGNANNGGNIRYRKKNEL